MSAYRALSDLDDLVIAKSVTAGRGAEAVVMDRKYKNKILYRSGLSFNKYGKTACQKWIDHYETWLKDAGWVPRR